MRNLKKILALVLALVMTFSVMAVANAFTDDKDIDPTFEESVDVLAGLGVFKGYEDGSYKPQAAISRAEVAAIIYRIVTGDVKDTQVGIYADHNDFTDVNKDSWYAGYVGFCANAEYIKGYGNGKFGPNDSVTGYQALAMILRAVGYDKNGEFTGSDWQIQTAAVGKKLGITDNVTTGLLGQAATREVVAEILFQSILVPQVSYTLAFGYQDTVLTTGTIGNTSKVEKNPSIGEQTFGLACYEGYVTWNGKAMILTDNNGTAATADDVVIKVADQDIFDAGRYGHVWTSKKSAVTDVYYDDNILATKYNGSGVGVWTKKGSGDYVATLADDVRWFYNGAEVTSEKDINTLKAAAEKRGVEVVLTDVDGAGDVNTVIVVEQKTSILLADPVVKDKNVRIFTALESLPLTTGTASGYEDLVEGSVVLYVKMADGVTYFEEAKAVTGEKTYYYNGKNGEYITFADEDYEQSDLTKASDDAEMFGRAKATFEVEATLFLDRGGYVVYTYMGGTSSSYAMIIDTYRTISDDHRSTEYYVNLLLADGTETGYVLCNPNLSPAQYLDAEKTQVNPAWVNLNDILLSYTLFPSALNRHSEYDGLGVLVKYTVSDSDVYSLSYCDYKATVGTDDKGNTTVTVDDLDLDYAAGAASMRIEGTPYAVTTASVAFYYWIDDGRNYDQNNLADRNGLVYHYGVYTGKGTEEGNIPDYEAGSETPFVEYNADADGDRSLKIGVINASGAPVYGDYAYIISSDGTGTTVDKETIYYYIGVLSDGSVVSFETNRNSDWAEGEVVAFVTNERGFSTFRAVTNWKASLNQSADGTTVKVMTEGSSSRTFYMNPGDVYDLVNSDLSVGSVADNYDLPANVVVNGVTTQRKVQAVLVPTGNAAWGGTDDWNINDVSNQIATAFVIDEDVVYGTFTVDGVEYYYPVTEYFDTDEAIEHSLDELNDVVYTADAYHIDFTVNGVTYTNLVKNDEGFEFVAGRVYTTTEHKAVTYTVAAANKAYTLSDDKTVLTVPYTTDLTNAAATLVEVIAQNANVSYRWDGNVDANTKEATLLVDLDSHDDHCDATLKITVKKAAADYDVELTQDNSASPIVLTVTLSADAQYDVNNGGKVELIRKANDVDNIVWTQTTTEAQLTYTTTQTGSYMVKVYNAYGDVVAYTQWLDVGNPGTVNP